MKNISFLKNALLLSTISLGALVFAQVQLNELTELGTSINDINDHGEAIHGNGYYDFGTNTSSITEEGIVQTIAINNAGQVLGRLADESGENFMPALKSEGVWTLLANMDDTINYILHGMSENGIYIVGQTEWSAEIGAWGFIYNTQTQTLTILDSPLYEYGAAYGVNNEGIAVGWVDDLPVGSIRMPAYFDEEGNITLIGENHGEASNINDNNEIVGNFEGNPFIFKIDDNEFTAYDTPDGYFRSTFSDISENNIAVGYAEVFVEGEGFSRDPIIFHTSLGAQPQMLANVLTEFGVDTSTLDGQVESISPNGKYLGGLESGSGFMAMGWAVYLDDAIMGISDLNSSGLTLYPNPVKDILNFNSKTQIQNISAYNLAGQQVISAKATNGQLNVSSLAPGVYVFQITLEGGKIETYKIIKK